MIGLSPCTWSFGFCILLCFRATHPPPAPPSPLMYCTKPLTIGLYWSVVKAHPSKAPWSSPHLKHISMGLDDLDMRQREHRRHTIRTSVRGIAVYAVIIAGCLFLTPDTPLLPEGDGDGTGNPNRTTLTGIIGATWLLSALLDFGVLAPSLAFPHDLSWKVQKSSLAGTSGDLLRRTQSLPQLWRHCGQRTVWISSGFFFLFGI